MTSPDAWRVIYTVAFGDELPSVRTETELLAAQDEVATPTDALDENG